MTSSRIRFSQGQVPFPCISIQYFKKNDYMRVTYYHRRPIKSFSIERVFEDVRKALPLEIQSSVAVSRFESRGFLRRFYNIIEAAFRQGDVNHVTGDVHSLTLLLRKKRTLLTIHDCVALERLQGLRKRFLFFFWYWLPEKRSSLVTAISESTKRELLRYLRCDPDKIKVVYNPISDSFKPMPKVFCEEKPTILQVGVSDNKNIPRVAKSLKGISCRLRIIGVPTLKQEMTLKENGIEYSSVSNISNAKVIQEYQNCDMLVFVSTYEGFGLPIVEANATGRPVVASNMLSMPEVAGDAACLVNPFDVESIRDGILRVVHDSKYREELVSNGFRNIERFDPKVIAAQYVELYKELLEFKG